MIFLDFCADGNHSENQLSLSFGMFVFCCHTANPRATSCSRTGRQMASQFVLCENTKSKTSPSVSISVVVPCDSTVSAWGTDRASSGSGSAASGFPTAYHAPTNVSSLPEDDAPVGEGAGVTRYRAI